MKEASITEKKTRVASAGYYNFSAVIETFIAASTTKEHIILYITSSYEFM